MPVFTAPAFGPGNASLLERVAELEKKGYEIVQFDQASNEWIILARKKVTRASQKETRA